MTTEEKLDLAIQALKKISTFGHTPDCDCKCAPIYECGCYSPGSDQWSIARETLKQLGEDVEDGY